MLARWEAENKLRAKEIEEKKNAEFNITLSQIKESVKTLEESLEQEKQNGKKLMEENEALKSKIQDLIQSKNTVVQHLEDGKFSKSS